MTLIFWFVAVIMFLGLLGGIVKLTTEGFKLLDFIAFLVVAFVTAIMFIIAYTGGYNI